MKNEEKSAAEYYMQEQQKHPMSFGAYTIPEQWQLDAMEAYAQQNYTMQDRDRMSRDIFNISRRIRQLSNDIPDRAPAKIKFTEYINKLNEIGTEIAGGVHVVMSKVLRS